MGLHREFNMVRCSDKATCDRAKIKSYPSLTFLDGDGDPLHYANVTDTESVEQAFKDALEKYKGKEIAWPSGALSDVFEKATGEKKLVILAFLDDKKESANAVTALQDRWVAKHHGKVVFTRIAYDRNSAECKEWGVTAAPTFLAVNPLEEDAKKRVVDRSVSKTQLVTLRAFILKALEKVQKAKKA